MEWKVRHYEVDRSRPTEKPVDQGIFGIEAPGKDEAKAEVKRWLEERGYEPRSIAFSAREGELIAYVWKQETK